LQSAHAYISLPFLGVEEFEEKEIVADGSNKKQNIFSNNNLNSKYFRKWS
jgi:hypothetical protein